MSRRTCGCMVVAVVTLLALMGDSTPAVGPKINLSGKWSINFEDGIYYFRQIGNELWWVGESKDGGKSWTNLGHGTINGDEITVHWADSPRGSGTGTGVVTLKLIMRDGEVTEIRKTRQVGAGFGGNSFKRWK